MPPTPADPSTQTPADKKAQPLDTLRFMRLRNTDRARLGAAQHALRVGVLRWVLPGAAGLLLLSLLIWPLLREKNLTAVAIENLPNLVIEDLRLSGFDDKNEPYELTAKRALKVQGAPHVFDLEQPQGELNFANGEILTGIANYGRFDQGRKKLWLGGDVAFYHDEGYQFLTPEAQLDLANNEAWGQAPVVIQGDFGRIEGNGFQIQDGGKTLIVRDHPKALLNLRIRSSSDRKDP